jgi:hypothetical protein
MPVVKRDVKPVQVGLAARGDVGHELLGRLAGLFGGNHDRRAVRIVGADEVHRVPLHALKPHPDVGLDVFHDVADVEIAVGIRQGGGDEKLARDGRGSHWRGFSGVIGNFKSCGYTAGTAEHQTSYGTHRTDSSGAPDGC